MIYTWPMVGIGYAVAGLATAGLVLIALLAIWQMLKRGANFGSAVRVFLGAVIMSGLGGYSLMVWFPAWGDQVAARKHEQVLLLERQQEAWRQEAAAVTAHRARLIQACVDAGDQWIEGSCFTSPSR